MSRFPLVNREANAVFLPLQKLAIREPNLRQIYQESRDAWRIADGCARQSSAENIVFLFALSFVPGSGCAGSIISEMKRITGMVLSRFVS